jgi:thiamine pyrophosphate-dependent acetolactate synthase large subunit-like protein
MSNTLRGADIVARSLRRVGCRRVFTLSGNHIMSIFDAALDAGSTSFTCGTKPPPCTWPTPMAA